IIRDSYAEEIKFRITREEYLPAVEALKEFLNRPVSGEDKSDIYFELGNLYALLNQMDDAIAAYEQVSNYSPSYEVELQTKIALGKALRQTGKLQQALEIFKGMYNEHKYSESFDVIGLEEGITLKELKSYEDAVSSLQKVDTAYAATPSASAARYYLGEIFETYYKNFDSASVYYQKAVSSSAPQEYLLKANDKSQLFKKYLQLNSAIRENKKKLVYLNNPEEFVKDSIAFFSAKNDSAETNQQTREAGIDRNPRGNSRREGNRNRPGVETSNQQVQKEKSIPPQRPNISADSIKSILIKSKYDLANLFFTEFNLPDSASAYYREILSEYPNSPYQARILYALGSYYEINNEPLKADSLYNFIYENYKNENIVNAAANKLKKPLIDLEFDPAKDLYSEAEKYLQKEDYKTSLNKFLDISGRFPKSPFAAKAMYAGGWIMENKLNMLDSAAEVYDSLTSKYPQTVYASDVRPKLNFYRQEQIRIKKAIEDSLKNLQIRADSSANSDSLKLIKDLPADSLNKKNERIDSSTKFNEKNKIIGPAVTDSLKRKEILEENSDEVRKRIYVNPDSSTGKGKKLPPE
ncbi:MAG TPA: tetratricopeptide repeat protein, partial [Ignavibacteriaceae bacterium]|nr:tetratricopeptide repeat protein [Ignavibacteriaceae bacterium]